MNLNNAFPEIELLDVALLDTSNKTQRYVVSFKDKHFEISKSVADLIQLLKENKSTQEIAKGISFQSKKEISKENVEEMITLFINPIFEAERSVPPPFYFNKQLLSAKAITPITSILLNLFRPIVALPLFAIAIFLQLYFLSNSSLEFHPNFYNGIDSILILCTLLFISVIFHELGHASACRYYGVEHGHIGIGLYLYFPIFYADVSKVWRIDRKKRMVVDFGGIYFQMILLIPTIIFYQWYSKNMVLEYLIYTIIISFLFDLNPFLKCDGYWICSDLLGISNFRKRTFELLSFLIKKIKNNPPPKAPYLFSLKLKEQIALVVYAVAINIFFVYYFAFKIPVFLFNSFSSVPPFILRMIQTGDYNVGMIGSTFIHVSICILMINMIIRTVISLSKSMHSFI